ncbi:MAG: hypothetical protein H6926_05420 [Chromatiales bacterium]|nr:hypothetical protein [Chromatiales bacterium]
MIRHDSPVKRRPLRNPGLDHPVQRAQEPGELPANRGSEQLAAVIVSLLEGAIL